ncbi:maleylpyruvate isomerase family mycothiol-dependent enzyme [Streptomyces sp. RKND-216]|uniref:maleylpyruvate isomerase family mycothiol-dependent enzyme n=1 Tax=Streptomyces sp. RKND-216 TaxID=2562581 RepID=UPI00109D86FA|nr:maleylpyruvate isomerase family mycothiol-dependent enzyme [Streptomyces sp. RKND-216]THA25620.1 maleylpyruvate isomerase family mycothiol-dependent enzyme [Streptomyces sp. RKND-216]
MAPPKLRSYDPLRVRKALTAQVESVAAAAHALTTEQYAQPSGLPGWDVHHLVVHIAGEIDALPRLLAEPEPDVAAPQVDLSTWALSTATRAKDLDEATRAAAAASRDAAARVDEAVEQLEPVLESAVRPDLLLPHGFGAMRALDFTVTRLVELVVHTDDLVRATGHRVPLDRHALAATVRLLADALAAKAPGRAVEVRVPPFAVTQCVEGPRHTRGTPSNVVETDPLTFLRLATGRTTWEAARARRVVQASGERADLSPHLPVLG